MLPPNSVKKEDYFYLNVSWIPLSSSLKEPEKAVYPKGMHLIWLVPLHSVAITRVFFENCILWALLDSCTCLSPIHIGHLSCIIYFYPGLTHFYLEGGGSLLLQNVGMHAHDYTGS
jgi:hypothetical protein